MSTKRSYSEDPYAPVGNDGYNFHTDYNTPYNFFELNLKRYTIKATHIVAKSYPVEYPITFNLSALTPYGERILIADRINSTDFENGNYAYFPLKKPTNIVSTKLQMTGRRMTKVGKHYNDWALEIFFFDIFGTLYNGTYTEKLSSPEVINDFDESIILATLFMDCF